MNLLSFLTNFIPGFGLVKIVAIAGAVVTVGWFVSDYVDAKEDQVNMAWERSRYENTIKVLRANGQLKQDTIVLLDESLKVRMGDLKGVCKIVADIAADKDPDADKPVGGIIGRTLKAIGILDKGK